VGDLGGVGGGLRGPDPAYLAYLFGLKKEEMREGRIAADKHKF